MSNKIDLCPFCGSKYVSVIVPVETEYQVQCGNCYASSSIESTEKKAIKSWNRRTPSDHIVVANKKADDNPPLTLEELRGMDREPVWIVEMPDWGHWELSENAEDYFDSRDVDFYGMSMPPSLPDPMGRYGLHMMGWLAYRHKPEGLEP